MISPCCEKIYIFLNNFQFFLTILLFYMVNIELKLIDPRTIKSYCLQAFDCLDIQL